MSSMATDVIPLVNRNLSDYLEEDDVRERLTQFAASRAVVYEMVITNIQSAMAYHYSLETFVEGRAMQRKEQPFSGTAAIIPPQSYENMCVWNIPVPPRYQFDDGQEEVILPESVIVHDCRHCAGRGKMECPPCQGTGKNACISCGGSGKEKLSNSIPIMQHSCVWCGATGERRCHKCKSRGIYICRGCKGKAKMRSYLSCSVQWQTFKDEHTKIPWDIPGQLIKDAAGVTVFEGETPTLSPVTPLPEEIISISQSFLEIRSKESVSEKILCQVGVMCGGNWSTPNKPLAFDGLSLRQFCRACSMLGHTGKSSMLGHTGERKWISTRIPSLEIALQVPSIVTLALRVKQSETKLLTDLHIHIQISSTLLKKSHVEK